MKGVVFSSIVGEHMQAMCSPSIQEELEVAECQKLLQLPYKKKRDCPVIGHRPLRCAGKRKGSCSGQAKMQYEPTRSPSHLQRQLQHN
ncbi:hypothetical protein CDAR_382231 [Caerostris darwini]|uniref:Uncharacterized protein n=1 Tax=Caerostris darwini TaxID=1538125 RepID=A0AAV4VZ07_9ARAC|nr:hypothetical protein CDAR_382231 [Caerostris darwini]